ncbi:MAG: FHA domain-containing protein [Nannocystaceae bacterium]
MPTAETPPNPTATAADAPTLRLRLQRQGASAETFVFQQDEVRIGRRPRGGAAATADLELPHRDVSRRQCRIFFQGPRLFLEDLGSAGGTFRNGRPLRGAEPLSAGDEFSFGGYRASVEVLSMGSRRGPVPTPVEARAPLRVVPSTAPDEAARPPRSASAGEPAAPGVDEGAEVATQADTWWRLGEPAALLLRGRALRRASRWLAARVEIHPDDRRRRFILASARGASQRRWSRAGITGATLATVLFAGWLGDGQASPAIGDHERPAIACTRARVDAAATALADDGRLDGRRSRPPRAAAALRWLAEGECPTADAEVALDRALIARRDAVLTTLPGAIVGVTPIVGDRLRSIVEGDDGALHLHAPDASDDREGLAPAVDPEPGARPWTHSGDGGWWARGDGRGRVDVWTALREPARVASLAVAGGVQAMAFDRAGRRLAISAEDGLTLWERDGPRWEVKARRPRVPGIPTEATMSIAGEGVIFRRGARLWWHPLVGGPAAHELAGEVSALVADGDDAWLVADGRGVVRRGRIRGRRLVSEPVLDLQGPIVGLHRLSGGDEVLVVGRGGVLVIVDPARRWRPGEAVSRRLIGIDEAPRSIASDGRWIVAQVGERLVVWDRIALAQDRRPAVEFTAEGLGAAALAVVDDAILTGDASGALRRWPIVGADGGLAGDLVVAGARVDLVAVGGGGRWFAASGDDRRTQVWRREPASPPIAVGAIDHGHDVVGLAIDPRGRWLAIAYADPRGLGPRPAARGGAARARDHGRADHRIALTDDGQWLVAGDARGGVSGWPLTDEGIHGAPGLAFSHDDAITALVAVPGDAAIVSGDRRGALVLSRPGGGARRRLGGHARAVVAAVVDPGGEWLATSAEDGQIRIARLADGAEARTLAHPGARALAFAPDGGWLVSGDERGELWLHALTGGERRRLGAHGPKTRIRALAFDGPERLISAGSDGALHLWELRRGARVGVREARALPGHNAAIRALGSDVEGRVVITGGEDGALRVWPLAPEERAERACRIAGHGPDPADFAGVFPADFVRGVCR